MLQKLRSYIKARKLIEEDRIEVTYEVKLSYKTSFQIWFRDRNNMPKLINKTGISHAFSVAYPAIENQIELLVFVKNNKLLSNQAISLCIKRNGKVANSQIFAVSNTQILSGWCKIAADIGMAG